VEQADVEQPDVEQPDVEQPDVEQPDVEQKESAGPLRPAGAAAAGRLSSRP
jgi:hypothetical protein